MAKTAETKRPFNTYTLDSAPTAGATNGVMPAIAFWDELHHNTYQIIVHNPSTTLVLYFLAVNSTIDTTYDLKNCIEVQPGAYMTIGTGVRSERVGDDYLVGLTTAVATFEYKITHVFAVET